MRDQDDGSMLERCHRLPGCLLAPVTENVSRHHVARATALRIPLDFPGRGVDWKGRPDFGGHPKGGLSKFTSDAVDGLLLAAVGALVLSMNRLGPVKAWIAAGLAIIGALSLQAQIGFSDPFLDGDAIPAALLLAIAVVALTRARADAASPSTTRSTP